MRRITIIDGHPDPSAARLNHALADRYAQSAIADGHEVRRIDVAQLDFSLLRNPDDFLTGRPVDAIANAQHDIAWADHLVLFFPLWLFNVPALLKGFMEQTFRPGFAIGGDGAKGFSQKLLAGKSARLVITMGMPAFIYRAYFGEHITKSLKQALNLCGIEPIEETLFGGVGDACERTRAKWMEQIAQAAQRDGLATRKHGNTLVRSLAATGLVLAGGYLAYAGATWARYGSDGSAKSDDALLDSLMPNYEVRVRHGSVVNASAQSTFEVIAGTDFERSALVRALFRAREVLMHAKHVESTLPRTLMEQVTALGWNVIGKEEGRELILGTATKPWEPSPVFRSLSSDEFVRFMEPGYTKIAFTLRVNPVSDQRCEAVSETRVQTTDPLSRARFRRYWAFLSPGIALIRLVLLRQIKSEAEGRWQSRIPVGAV